MDELESDPDSDDLVDAIWDTIDLICEEPQSAHARRRALRTARGQSVWLVPIRYRSADEPWVVLWQPRLGEALIAYIGPADFRPNR